jgi:hypothetical protein
VNVDQTWNRDSEKPFSFAKIKKKMREKAHSDPKISELTEQIAFCSMLEVMGKT